MGWRIPGMGKRWLLICLPIPITINHHLWPNYQLPAIRIDTISYHKPQYTAHQTMLTRNTSAYTGTITLRPSRTSWLIYRQSILTPSGVYPLRGKKNYFFTVFFAKSQVTGYIIYVIKHRRTPCRFCYYFAFGQGCSRFSALCFLCSLWTARQSNCTRFLSPSPRRFGTSGPEYLQGETHD